MESIELLKPRPISGFADYSETENAALAFWIRKIESTYRSFGFTRLTPRPLELREVLMARGGIQKQVYGVSRLPDDAATDLALPFDRTVPMANWVAQNAGDLVFPYKRYDISYSYRGERAQAGRFRGFFQADIDIIGSGSLDETADAECIAVVYQALGKLSLGTFTITLNHIGLAKAILLAYGVVDEQRQAFVAIDKLVKIGADATIAELCETTSISQEKARELVDVFGYEGALSSFIAQLLVSSDAISKSANELESVILAMMELGVPSEVIKFQPGIVRGLDYYTGTVFETFLTGLESIGSVASGGRYEDLVSTFSTLSLPGVGGSIGLTRLFYVACAQNLIPMTTRTEANAFVGFRTPEQRRTAQGIAKTLRENGVNVDLYCGTGAFKKQLNYADRKGVQVAIFPMGEDSIVVKDLRASIQSDHTSIAEAVNAACKLLQGAHS